MDRKDAVARNNQCTIDCLLVSENTGHFLRAFVNRFGYSLRYGETEL